MSVSSGPRRGFIINALTGDGFDADFRKLLRGIDALLAAAVINLTTSAPPGSPANGDAYVVKATGTGAWAGHDHAIAVWTTDNPAASSGEWEFYPAALGLIVANIADATLYFWNGSAWTAVAGGGGGGGSSTLAGDSDVDISSPANDDVLTFEASTSLWKNKPASGGGGGNFADNETPTTWTTNSEYILAHAPNPAASLQVFIQDSGSVGCDKLLIQGVDYHLASGTHIVYDVTPAATNEIRCWYRY